MKILTHNKRATESGQDGRTTHRLEACATGGFVLLEVILALALFGLVAVSMTSAINQMALASRSARQEGQVLRRMESVLAEVSHQAELRPDVRSYPANDEGVSVEATIEEAKLLTKLKATLDHEFRVTVDAWIQDGRQRLMKRHVEIFVYAPDEKK